MPPVLNYTETAEGLIFTASTDTGSVVTALDHINSGDISEELEKAYAALTPPLNQLQTSSAAIVHNSHPRLVNEQIQAEIVRLMAGPINSVIETGRAEKRVIAEAIDRASNFYGDVNETLRSAFQARFTSMEPPDILQIAMKPGAPVELTLAALDTAQITGLADQLVDELREQMVYRTALAQVASNAAATPTSQEPFAIGVDDDKAQALAQAMLDRHRARVEAVEIIENAISRLLTMLAVLCGASGPDVIWAAIRK